MKDRMKEARSKLLNLFKGPLSDEVMHAMEDLLEAMSIDNKTGAKMPGKTVAPKAK